MTYKEAFLLIENLPLPTDDENYDIYQYQEAKTMVQDALISKQHYQEKVQNCIDKIK